MRRALVLVILALLSSAVAADVVVHPFRSQDPVVGVALAERIASALGDVDVLGPEVAPTLVAPIVVPGGYLNPLSFLRAGPFDRSAVAILAGAVGVRVAVSGVVAFEDAGVRLDLVASVDGAIRSATLRAVGVDLDALVRQATPVVAFWAGARPLAPRPLDLRGGDEVAARARTLIGAGFVAEAMGLLDELVDPAPEDARLRDDLRHALQGTGGGDPALAAMVSLASADPALPAAAFARWRAAGGPPVAEVWAGAWARSVGDDAGADRAFAAAAAAYPFGRAARAADLAASGDPAAADALAGLLEFDEPAALLAAALVAGASSDPVTEDAALTALGRAAPFFTYPFERRSFLAFDRDDALTAASVLAVAVDLDAESDLYWTNLGWAWYLLGRLERSESASLRALELDPAQVVARYNLGLVRVVTGRLDPALADYREALRFDPDVDAEAVADLVAAEERYPDAVGVAFALGFLLESSGDRAGAAAAYERYLARVAGAPGSAGGDTSRAREADVRVAALRAPLPPIEIGGPLTLTLGRRGDDLREVHPGDPLTVAFEVTTPGDALPRRLELAVELRDAAGAVVVGDEGVVDVPTGAIGYVIDVLAIELPTGLSAGAYTLAVRATGDGVEARASRPVAVVGEAERVRRLVGRGLVFTALDTGQALFAARDVAGGAEALWARLLAELRSAAALAEEALPVASAGRFAGLGGAEVFLQSDEGDIRDFVDHLLASGARYTTFAFVDAYAQWVLDGTP